MSRPDDVPSWKEATRRSWESSKWLLLLMPATYAMALILPKYLYNLDQASAKQAEEIASMTNFMCVAMPIVAAFLWTLIFLNWILLARTDKTPKEIEAQERHMLARLREKYPDS